jgi:hypothetical protein
VQFGYKILGCTLGKQHVVDYSAAAPMIIFFGKSCSCCTQNDCVHMDYSDSRIRDDNSGRVPDRYGYGNDFLSVDGTHIRPEPR